MIPKEGTRQKISFIRVVGTGFAIILVIYLLSEQGWSDIRVAIVDIGWRRFLLALGVMFVSRFMVIARWHVLLRSGQVDMSLGESARLTFAGLFANNFLLSTVGGDVVRLAGAVQAGYDSAVSAASLVVDRLVGMAGMAVILPVGLQKLLLYNAFSPSHIAAGAAISMPRKIYEKGKDFGGRLIKAMAIWLRQPRGLIAAWFFTLGHMASLFGANWILLEGMGETVSFWEIGGFQSLIYFVTLIPISINGWGLQELSTTFIFTELAGVAQQNSLTLSLLIRTLFILTSLPGAFYLRAILPSIDKKAE